MTPLSYDIVIATRNRAASLARSIPLQLEQSRPPAQLIVVDSSDDHAEVRTVVTNACRGHRVPVTVVRAAIGLPLQRNRGLERVRAPVVFYPDDDALWHPGFAERCLRIYERDEDGVVGGVGGFETRAHPLTHPFRPTPGAPIPVLNRSRAGRWVPDPLHVHGRSRYRVRAAPSWLTAERAVHVEYVTGFRMSFRSEVIRAVGFDETLSGYALCEDIDACFGIMRTHLMVDALDAHVLHERAPGARGGAKYLGAGHILNRAYVIAKHAAPGAPVRDRVFPHACYKVLQYSLMLHSRWGRQRFHASLKGLRRVGRLMSTPLPELSVRYRELFAECIA